MKYYPILISKAGELTALANLSQHVKEETSPVIEVLSEALGNVEAHLLQHWSFPGNQVLIDFSLFEDIEERSAEVRPLFERLIAAGVNAVPVVQQNSFHQYIDIVRDLIASFSIKVCIRTSNQSGGFIGYITQVEDLVTALGTNSANTLLLLDLGYVENHTYNNLAAVAILTVQALLAHNNQWAEIIVGAGSFPENLNGLVPNNVYHLDRYEWHIWLLIQASEGISHVVKYSDYGTKNPVYTDASFLGTSSIKYTTADHFVIYRGELPQNHPRGMGQYIDKARALISTADYSGSGFSWGDGRMDAMVTANTKTGNPKTWVEISQNHHITLLHSLV
jgi:hypothetical protein